MSYNHEDWTAKLESFIDFITMFGAVIVWIVWAMMGFTVAHYFAFIALTGVGGCKFAIKLIDYFNNK